MKQEVDSQLYRGSVNRDLQINFHYTYSDEGKFPTVMNQNNRVKMYPSFMLNISEGYGKPFIPIPSSMYASFISLLDKSLKQISENLYTIFPDVGKIEFDIDSKTLEIYETEKAITTNGMTAVPAVWVDQTSQCFPAIKITSTRYPTGVKIPLEDAMAISKMLSCFDVHTYGLTLLSFCLCK